jgi:hypothetical protein
MSFTSPDPGTEVLGISTTDPASHGAYHGGLSGGPAVGGVHSGDVLAFTGTGPGTLPLALIGIGALVVGLWAHAFSRKKRAHAVEAPRNGLADLSPLADHLD